MLHSPVQEGMCVDAMSVFAAATADHIKIPAEKNLLSYLQYARDRLDKDINIVLA